ncbi:AP-2 complex subunit beta [Phthorimaea operculella]|nr:AP-2 complex subunit beta [Phthorimaea operculella]
MTDSKYFTTTKKGEIFELKSELNSDKKEKKKEAVKKVIASMTVGKDVSALFPDVVNCMQTDNLELKKLVYLYLMNYAKSQPDMAIMAVNTFVKNLENLGQQATNLLNKRLAEGSSLSIPEFRIITGLKTRTSKSTENKGLPGNLKIGGPFISF